MFQLISVIVPVYKVEKYLDECIKSILSQTYKHFELILVDDGSPDSCGKMCDQYAKEDTRIIVIHKSNGGLSDARNTGLRAAKGDYITYIDSDDAVDTTYLEVLVNAIIRYDADIAQVDYTKDSANLGLKTAEDVVLESSNIIVSNLFHYLDFKAAAWAKLFKREIAEKVLFPKGRLYEDVLTAYRFAFYANRFIVCHSNLYYYRINPLSIMHQPLSEYRFTEFTVFDEIETFFKEQEKEKYIQEFQIDIDKMRTDALYYEFRTKLYVYNECLGRGGNIKIPDQMNTIQEDLCSERYDSIELNFKYKVLKQLLRISPRIYELLAVTLRKVSE